MIPILSVRGLTKVFEIPKREPITAVSNVTFDLAAGTALGVVGDSGCGKSTLVRLIMRLMPSTAGTILLKGHDITHLNERALREVYRTMQMVFQQPAASFDPRRTLGDGIGEPLRNQGCTRHEADRCAAQLLERCGLTADLAARYPHEVSGGQCQRAAIARALALEPELRFSRAEEFSRALLQYQQTKSLEKTRKEKQRRKWISLLSVFLVLAIVGGTVGYLWLSRAAKATLPDATVDIWFTADPLRASGQNKIAALNAAADAFRTLYPNVELRLQSIAPEQYEQQLKQAEQDGTLPVLFERTAQNAELARNAKAIRQLNRQISSEEFRLAAPVSGEYAALGYGLPVLYASNACAEGIGFDFRQATGATLTSLASLDLKAGMKASFLPAYEVLFQSSIPETDNMKVSADTLDAFLSGEQGLYYGDTADAADVQAQMTGRYRLYAVQSPESACMLQNVWSITQKASKKETACAVRFLSYLLSEDGQRCLYLENHYPCVPISSAVYEEYRDIAGELADILAETQPRSCGIA